MCCTACFSANSDPLVSRLRARSHIMSKAFLAVPTERIGVVYSTPAQPGLGDLEPSPLLAHKILDRDAALVEPQVAVAAVAPALTAHAHVADQLQAGGVVGHQHHGKSPDTPTRRGW